MLDSEADISVADINVFDKYHLSDICQIYKSDKEYISTASQNKMFIKGRVQLQISLKGKVTSVIFHLISGLPTDFILGLDWLKQNNAVNFGRKQMSIHPL